MESNEWYLITTLSNSRQFSDWRMFLCKRYEHSPKDAHLVMFDVRIVDWDDLERGEHSEWWDAVHVQEVLYMFRRKHSV